VGCELPGRQFAGYPQFQPANLPSLSVALPLERLLIIPQMRFLRSETQYPYIHFTGRTYDRTGSTVDIAAPGISIHSGIYLV
jgi:hypothetical protein